MNLLERVLRKMPVEHLAFLRDATGKALFEKLERSEQVRVHWSDENKSGRGGRTSPWAPSLEEASIYKSYIKLLDHTPVRALVLGGTPMLRELLFSFSIPSTIVDQSLTMLERTSRILGDTIVSKEMLIKSNWLDLHFLDGFFDVVIGDLVLFQFLPKDQDAFFAHVKKLLTPRGAFITRVHCVSPDIYNREVTDAIQDIVSSDAHGKSSADKLMAFLFDRCGNLKEGKTNRAAAIQALKNYMPKSEEESRIIQEAVRDWGGSFLDYALQQEDEVIKKFESHFSEVLKRSSGDYEGAGQYPIICARD